MNIGAVHTALANLLDDLSITSPFTQAAKKVWPVTPPAGVMVQPYTFMTTHNLTGVRFLPNGVVEQKYDLHVQFFGMEASGQADIGAAVANAFLDALVTMLSTYQRFNGTDIDLITDLRGAGSETITVLSWGGKNFVGLDLILPVTLTDVRTRGA